MAYAIKIQSAKKEIAGRVLFEEISFNVEQGERVALIGRNGVGKTTLIEALFGLTPLDAGRILRGVPLERFALLRQTLEDETGLDVLSYLGATAQAATEGIAPSSVRRKALATDGAVRGMTRHVAPEAPGTPGVPRTARHRAESAAAWAGLPPAVRRTRLSQLSGGEKTRVQLAALRLRDPEVIVLDEPTNHLDAESLDWLERWLCETRATVLFVSHDRTFIDRVAHAVVELTPGGARRFAGGYTAFHAWREQKLCAAQALYDKQQREKRALQETIAHYREWYQRAHDAAGIDFGLRKKAEKNSTRFKAKERALLRLEQRMVERPDTGPRTRMELGGEAFAARTLVQLTDIGHAYGSRRILHPFSLTIQRGDRFAVLGPNGAGKSTLLKLIAGVLQPTAGEVARHPALRIGYFAQELDGLDPSRTVLDTLLAIPEMTASYARTILAGFLFPAGQIDTPVGGLSMGERCRISFIKLYLSAAHLLVLDEPTNYLDIDTRERIEDALLAYPGAVVMVSHDRMFADRIANAIVFWENGRPKAFRGSYREWADRTARADHTVTRDASNAIARLELHLAYLMGLETPATDADQAKLMDEIRRTKRELDALGKK